MSLIKSMVYSLWKANSDDIGNGGTALTAGRIPIATGGSTLGDDSGLTFNTTTNALGVGGATTITGSANSVQLVVINNSSQTVDMLQLKTAAGTIGTRSNPEGTQIAFGQNDYRLELGNVGIGFQSTLGIVWAPAGPYSNSGDIFNVSDTGMLRSSAGIVKFTAGASGNGGFLSQKGSSIVGSADEVQLSIKGHSTQNANFWEVKNSSNTVLAKCHDGTYGRIKSLVLEAGDPTGTADKFLFWAGTPPNLYASSDAGIAWDSDNDAYSVSQDTGLARAAAGVISINNDGSADTNGATLRYKALSPAQITSNQNNYNPGGKSYFQRWNTDASRDVTGLTFAAAQVDGQCHLIVNVGSQNIVLKHKTTSTASNQFNNSTAADITLSAGQAADVIYDGATSYWLVFKRN